MKVKIEIILDVGEQDTTADGFETAQNQLRASDLETIIALAEYEEVD